MSEKLKITKIKRIVEACHAAREAGLLEDALRLINEGLAEFPNNRMLWIQASKLLNQMDDRQDETLDCCTACIDKFKERAIFPWFKMSRRLIEKKYRFSTKGSKLDNTRRELITDLHTKARKYLITPTTKPESDVDQALIAQEVSEWISEWEAAEQGSYQDLAAHFANYPRTKSFAPYRGLIRAMFRLGPDEGRTKFTEIKARLEREFPLGPTSSPAVTNSDPEASTKLWLGISEELIMYGEVYLAKSILDDLPVDNTRSQEIRRIAEELRSRLLETNQETSQPPSFEATERNSIIEWSPNQFSDKVIFVFTGATQRFHFTLSFFHRLLENLGCHIVYLKDNDNEFFMRGECWNGPEELKERFQNIVSDLGVSKVYTLGASSGGYAALRYGIALQADGILSFNNPLVSPADAGLHSVQMAFQSLHRKFPDEEFDLVQFCRNAPKIPPTTLAFSEGCERDRTAAEKLMGLPNIELVMAKGATAHASIKAFVAQGQFFPMLEKMIALPYEN